MKLTQQSREKLLECFAIYFSVSLCWSVWRLLVVPRIASLGGVLWLNTLAQCLLWVGPVLLAFRFEKDGWLEIPGRMFRTSFPFIPFLTLLCATASFLYIMRVFNGLQEVAVVWEWRFLLLSLRAGLVEEIFFRGFFFNRTAGVLDVVWAAILNGVVFALYHYPELFLRFECSGILSLRFLMLFAVGVGFSLAFAKWRNLWLTIVIHTFWNLLSYLWALAG